VRVDDVGPEIPHHCPDAAKDPSRAELRLVQEGHADPCSAQPHLEFALVQSHDVQLQLRAAGQFSNERSDLRLRPSPQVA
jgi:hypothetical protein